MIDVASFQIMAGLGTDHGSSQAMSGAGAGASSALRITVDTETAPRWNGEPPSVQPNPGLHAEKGEHL
jgi:hypothetical protein